MTDTATSRYGVRQQSQGSNTNTWGDDKLNEALRLFDRGSKGVQSLAVTGDTTLAWSNYVATNTGQCAVLVLTGSLSAAAALTVPSVEWQWDLIKNSTGQTVTVKTAAGAGVAIPNGRQVPVFCDGVDCYFGASNYLGAETTETNNRDLMDKAAVESAIANATLPATAGTVLSSITDTTAGYLASKISVNGAPAIIGNPGSNEYIQITTAGAAQNTPQDISDSTASAGNVTSRYANENHVHAHGNRSGGSLHAAADTSSAGFMGANMVKALNMLSGVATSVSGDTSCAAWTRYRVTSNKTMTLPTMGEGDALIIERDTAAGTVTIGRNSQTIDGVSADFTIDVNKVSVLVTCTGSGAVATRYVGNLPS